MPRKARRFRRKSVYLWSVVIVIVLAVTVAYLEARSPAGGSGTGAPNTTGTLLTINYQNPVLGSKDSPYTIFEFGDFQCPSCDYWYKTQERLVVNDLVDTGRAKLVWRDFMIYNSDSRVAASAAYAAGEQGKFWEFHNLLYANQGQPNSGWITQQLMVNFAQQLGLNITQFTHSMNSGKYNSLIDSNFQAGLQLGMQGTPGFIVLGPNGKYVTISGPQPESVFQQAITNLGG